MKNNTLFVKTVRLSITGTTTTYSSLPHKGLVPNGALYVYFMFTLCLPCKPRPSQVSKTATSPIRLSNAHRCSSICRNFTTSEA